MRKPIRIMLIIVITSGMIYLGLGYGLTLFSTVDEPSGDVENLDFEGLKTNEQQLPVLEDYETRDNSRLYYRYYDSTAEQVVILIHGSGYHSAYLEPLATNLAEGGVASVYTPNMRGHGPEPENRGDIGYIGQVENDLNDFIEMITERHPDEPIILGGHSSGGGTVIRMAGGPSSHDAVEGYLLLAPYIHHNAPTNSSDKNDWANVATPRMVGLSMLNQVGIMHMNDLNVISFNMPTQYRDRSETLKYSYRLQISMHPRTDYETDISAMNGDVLVLAGDEDESFQTNYYDDVFKSHPDTDIILMDGLSHFDPISDPKAHNEIADWIRDALTINDDN